MQHRMFKVLAHKDTYSVVVDRDYNVQYKSFLLSQHNVGDEFLLFIKNYDDQGEPIFEYSVLNDYREQEFYEFNVLDTSEYNIIVGDTKGVTVQVPRLIENNIQNGKIRLLVQYISRTYNKLELDYTMKVSQDRIQYEADLSIFEDEKEYELRAIRTYTNRFGRNYLMAEYLGKKYSITIPQIEMKIQSGDLVSCKVAYYNQTGNRFLNLSRKFIISKIYSVGSRYTFTIINKVFDPKKGMNFWVVQDEYTFKNNYHVDQDHAFEDEMNQLNVNDKVSLYVKKISDKGYLRLVNKIGLWERKTYTPEMIFSEIGYEDKLQEYFYNLKTLDDDSEDFLFLSQYAEGENLWVFTYLSFLDKKFFEFLEQMELQKAKILIDLYVKIEVWLLEGSDFLTNFSAAKGEDIVVKAEDRISKLKGFDRAISMLLNKEITPFLKSLKAQFETDSYVSDENKALLKSISVIVSFCIDVTDDDLLLELIFLMLKNNYISKEDAFEYSNVIFKKVAQLNNQVNLLDVADQEIENQEVFKSIINKQFLLLLVLNIEETLEKNIHASVNLMKYLSVFNKEVGFLQLGIQLITSGTYLQPKTAGFQNVFDLKLEDYQSFVVDIEKNDVRFKGSGTIFRKDKKLYIIPFNLYKGSLVQESQQLLKLEPFELYLQSHFELDELSIDQKAKQLISNIESVIEFRKSSRFEDIKLDFVDKVYRGKVKSIQPGNHYCFIRCRIDNNALDTIFHIKNILPSRVFDTLDSIIFSYDSLNFKIKEIEDGKIIISFLSMFEAYAQSLLRRVTNTYGKVLKVEEDVVYVIAQKGYIVKIENKGYKEGEVLDFGVKAYDSDDLCFVADNEKVFRSIKSFNMKENKLFRTYLLACGVIYNENSNLEINRKRLNMDEISNDFNLKLLTYSLINCLELNLSFIKTPNEKLLNYFYLNMLCGICNHPKSYLYFEKLQELIEILKIREAQSLDSIIDYVNGGAELQQERNFFKSNEAFKLLKYIDTSVVRINEYNNENHKLFQLKKLIEAYNLLKSFGIEEEILKSIKNLIINEMYYVMTTAEEYSQVEIS